MTSSQPSRRNQRGASLVEFSIVGLSAIVVGLFILQMGLLYHAKTTLNYAAFEAARAGAVTGANMNAMRVELGYRLAPLQGGDGSEGRAWAAIAKSSLSVLDPFNTSIAILNPTPAAFDDWSVRDPNSGKRFIPINHLRHQQHGLGKHSGLSLRDALLLKLQVTHGVKLSVPVVGPILTRAMVLLDRDNAVYYLRGRWPMQAVATVRMQSDSLEEEILKSASVSATSSSSGGGGTQVGFSGPSGGTGLPDAGGFAGAGNSNTGNSGLAGFGDNGAQANNGVAGAGDNGAQANDGVAGAGDNGAQANDGVAGAGDNGGLSTIGTQTVGMHTGGQASQPPLAGLPCVPRYRQVEPNMQGRSGQRVADSTFADRRWQAFAINGDGLAARSLVPGVASDIPRMLSTSEFKAQLAARG